MVTGGKGFTLLEVMVAVAILAIALVTLLGSQSRSLSVDEVARFQTRAALLARDRMTLLLLEDPAGLGSDEGDFGDRAPGYFWRLETRSVGGEESGIDNGDDLLTELILTVGKGHQVLVDRCLVLNGEGRR